MNEGCLNYKVLKSEGSLSGLGCAYDGDTEDHEIKNCEEFKDKVLNLLRFKILRC